MTSNGLKKISNDLKMTSKDKNDQIVSEKVESKNKLKGGDPNDGNPIKRRDVFEPAFSPN